MDIPARIGRGGTLRASTGLWVAVLVATMCAGVQELEASDIRPSLPPRALLRIGTDDLRTRNSPVTGLAFSPDVRMIDASDTTGFMISPGLPNHTRMDATNSIGNGLTIPANGGTMEPKEESPMDTMNIALPETMKHFVQERVSEGGYSSVSEYIRELIRADQKRKAEERIDALLLEGLDSGQPIAVTPEYWEEKKRRLTERLSKASHPQ
ncbi:MAG: type II toxin-antitoxin system ParD family antitoxin [Isosphaeraceae bacterium]